MMVTEQERPYAVALAHDELTTIRRVLAIEYEACLARFKQSGNLQTLTQANDTLDLFERFAGPFDDADYQGGF